ncbi:unnamed protein product [Heligmosomoides polygyrus]|uniref:vitamin-K-epoxide reductase (warfarin-sensitive) n=1 Tax=Heligmosomoides polygyrus TaxID=6339 RepID=A0A183FM69_HELPZ|nr:unnamed protein product [Heligmosomoides polygyrus]
MKPGRPKVDRHTWLWTDVVKAKVREKKSLYHVFPAPIAEKMREVLLRPRSLYERRLRPEGLYVEIRFEMDHDYTAMCDISSTVSCSRVLTSKYGTGFGIVAPLFGGDSFLNQKNALYGVMGYTVLALIQLSHTRCSANVSFPIAILLNVMSFYLIISEFT